MRATVAILTALTLIPGSAIAGYQSPGPAIFPQGWNAPSGWHVDRLVKRAVADGDLTGTGLPARAVLLTNDVSISLVVFIDYKSPSFKVYTVFVEPAADLKSDAGIKIDSPKPIEIEPAPDLCGSKWLRCDKRKYFFDPPMPSLWLQMGDWGGSVFRWKNLSQGFDRLSVGE